MGKKLLITLGLLVIVLGSVTVYGVYRWSAFRAMTRSQTVERAEWEHGITLPASVTNIECHGEAYILWAPDKGACTAFEMRKLDVPALKSRLGSPVSYMTYVPGNRQYQQHTFSWLNGSGPAEEIGCTSSTGDWLHVEIWPIDDGNIGVRMYTDWN